ncbi:polyphosphate kinase 1 [Treponema sp.]|uniref:polyphosphate kinase 1 n=1 Tax=Treponema sp. TaxID=166 RepID=UPI0038905A43
MQKFFNRELSWIEFNARVLSESLRNDVPLLERLNFLSITESNFDEFFQVRVASLKRQNTPESKSILKKISERTRQLIKLEYSTLMNMILPELKDEGIEYIKPSNYTPTQKAFCEKYFKHDIFPLLTPLRTDTEFFPRIGNLNLNAAFLLERKEGIGTTKNALSTKDDEIVALVQIPGTVQRILWIPSAGNKKQFALLDDIICMCGASLFPGYSAKETLVFKIARDADLAVDEEAGQQFIQAMEEVLVKRQSSFTVRMEYNSTSEKILEVLKSKLKLTDDDLYEIDGIIDPSSLSELQNIENSEMFKYPTWRNFNSNVLPEEGSYWNTLRQRDVLLNVPYESYDPVVKFISQAAHDKNVLAIKMTLYRTGNNSPIVESLKEAAQNGKQVTAFVELKARFDEKRNISWAEELEQAGVTVIYGIVNLKVHAKICLVIRKESDGIRRYAHIGTGNYNPKTALIYQDLSVFTSNHDIVSDATLFFNVISGYSAIQTMHHLYMAPVSLKAKILELIQREIQQSSKEKPGHIIAKMNSLCHPEIIEALYEASKAGVKIDLNIRGICTLIPGIKRLSDNINVVSVIDRYLEHSRIFYFQNGGQEEIYLASADWMERNLDKRIELMIPITDRNVFKSIRKILDMYFKDNCRSHVLLKNGKWRANIPTKRNKAYRVQEELYKHYKRHREVKKSLSNAEFIVRRKN